MKTNPSTTTAPNLSDIRDLPLAELKDISRKTARTGSTRAVRYKIIAIDSPYSSVAAIIDWHGGTANGGSRSVICDSEAKFDQFLHRGC